MTALGYYKSIFIISPEFNGTPYTWAFNVNLHPKSKFNARGLRQIPAFGPQKFRKPRRNH